MGGIYFMKKFTLLMASIFTLSVGMGVTANAQDATVEQGVTAEIIKGDFIPTPTPDKPSPKPDESKPGESKPSDGNNGNSNTATPNKPTGEKPNIKDGSKKVSKPNKPNIDTNYLDTGAGKSTIVSMMGLALLSLGLFVLKNKEN